MFRAFDFMFKSLSDKIFQLYWYNCGYHLSPVCNWGQNKYGSRIWYFGDSQCKLV